MVHASGATMARRRSGKKIDFVHWTYGSQSFVTQAQGTAAKTLFAAQHLSETLLRLRGNASGFIGGAAAPPVFAECALGIILVPEGSGTTVTWSPVTDGDAPWIWVDYFVLGYEEAVTDVIDVPGLTGVRSVIDNKAMRIMRNQEVQLVVEITDIVGTFSGDFHVGVRLLAGT